MGVTIKCTINKVVYCTARDQLGNKVEVEDTTSTFYNFSCSICYIGSLSRRMRRFDMRRKVGLSLGLWCQQALIMDATSGGQPSGMASQ